jgi:uncharacterized protein (TIGR03067 family)
MFKSLFGAAIVAALAISTAVAADTAPRVEGSYTIVSGERNGKALPAEDFTGSLVVIAKDTIVGTDKDKKQFFSCTYTLDAGSKPMKITMKSTPMGQAPKDKESAPDTPGLIQMDGDTIKIVYALPGGKPPTDFKTGKDQQMFVLKRMEVKK